jgi:hypothetical protein
MFCSWKREIASVVACTVAVYPQGSGSILEGSGLDQLNIVSWHCSTSMEYVVFLRLLKDERSFYSTVIGTNSVGYLWATTNVKYQA